MSRCVEWVLHRQRRLAWLALPLLASTSFAHAAIPGGFKPLFNGRDTQGWHWSGISHHGSVGSATVDHGEIVLRQRPYGQGGLLLTDKRYRNFELYLEVKAPWGVNSGIFLRSTEGGSAYQIELAPGAGTGGLIGEVMSVSQAATNLVDVNTVWKPDAFNSMRILMDGGEKPHVALWINDVKIWEVQEPRNDKIAGEQDGKIGLQLHWGSVIDVAAAKPRYTNSNWKAGAEIRFRNIGIRELP